MSLFVSNFTYLKRSNVRQGIRILTLDVYQKKNGTLFNEGSSILFPRPWQPCITYVLNTRVNLHHITEFSLFFTVRTSCAKCCSRAASWGGWSVRAARTVARSTPAAARGCLRGCGPSSTARNTSQTTSALGLAYQNQVQVQGAVD